jgi:hypothetical protein
MDLSKLTYFEKLALAENPSTHPETLTILAGYENDWIRYDVANNPNAPPETLAILACDKNYHVRYKAVSNPNTPQYIKDYLTAQFFLSNYS